MTHRADNISLLKRHPSGLDDDEIAKVLRISPRQTVNMICRQLAKEGLVDRSRSTPLGKIANRWTGTPDSVESLPSQMAGSIAAGTGRGRR